MNTPYSPLHLMPSLYSMSTPPASMTHTTSPTTVNTMSLTLPTYTLANSTSASIVPLSTGLPQPPVWTLSPEAFNWQHAITDAINSSVKTMERHFPQTIGHPTTYEDLLDEVENTPFTQAVVDTPLPTKFHTPTFVKYDCTTDPHENICQYRQVMIGTIIPSNAQDAIMYKLFVQSLKGPAIQPIVLIVGYQ
ncbi:hypothetical protein TIFTF001_029498 [Ficus carica]|uniref:Uncharacterized protein n=1 Tax=Ficus carica TaxID=3494 RepID=A0AA88J2I2_FICCA|nr:hypothetical protein TIFTF001_029498 [Ficus carica]